MQIGRKCNREKVHDQMLQMLFLNLNNCGCFLDFKRTSSGIMRGIGDLLHTVSVLY